MVKSSYTTKRRWFNHLYKVIIILGLTIMIMGILLYHNQHLTVSTYTMVSKEIPARFDGYRIALLSDIHNDTFGQTNQKLVETFENTHADLLAISGDLLHSYDTDIDIAIDLVNQLLPIAPVVYVNGNHEARIEAYPLFEQELKNIGVTVLNNQTMTIDKDGQTITIGGIQDPHFIHTIGTDEEKIKASLDALNLSNDNGYTILLAHHPKFIEIYRQYPLNLVLSGHAHGGQIRLPFIGGLVAPGQGFFPEYDNGAYDFDGLTMVVSRGIGNSFFPLRINNDP